MCCLLGVFIQAIESTLLIERETISTVGIPKNVQKRKKKLLLVDLSVDGFEQFG